jgi:hypothetical protein
LIAHHRPTDGEQLAASEFEPSEVEALMELGVIAGLLVAGATPIARRQATRSAHSAFVLIQMTLVRRSMTAEQLAVLRTRVCLQQRLIRINSLNDEGGLPLL